MHHSLSRAVAAVWALVTIAAANAQDRETIAAAQREGKPVLIDMWATWCKNCLTMDKTTLADARVKAALDRYVKVKFQAEDPEVPGTKEVMQKFGAVGLPAYGVLKAK